VNAALKPSPLAEFIPIPPTAKRRQCRYCPKMIYLAPHPSTGNPHPVAIDTHPGSYAPSGKQWGQGITHYWDCEGVAEARADSASKRLADQAELAL
jgi:hypothetical protein